MMTTATDSTSDPYPESMWLDLPFGALNRIDSVREPGETREDFVRAAAKALIAQRKAEKGERGQ